MAGLDIDLQHSYNHHGMQRNGLSLECRCSVLTKAEPTKASTRKCWYAIFDPNLLGAEPQNLGLVADPCFSPSRKMKSAHAPT